MYACTRVYLLVINVYYSLEKIFPRTNISYNISLITDRLPVCLKLMTYSKLINLWS